MCIFDYATLGIFDRAGNIKFQDFLQFPISARLIAEGRAAQLYDEVVLNREIRTIVGPDTTVYLQYFYGPQVALPFVPLQRFPFRIQAEIWVTLSLLIYAGCVYLVWRTCPELRQYAGLVSLCALAYPPLFHFFVRGQLSAIVLLCFTLAYLAFRARQDWLGGIALGVLVFKPQFLIAVPLLLLLGQSWTALVGLVVSAGAQLVFTRIYFGAEVMRAYLTMLLHSAARPRSTELVFSPIQMHSLHSFWELLVPWPRGVWILYLVTSLAVMWMAASVWKSRSPLALRFTALLLAAVLVNPHIYIYDLLALAPAFLLITDWLLANEQDASSIVLRPLLYLAFVLPLFGPLARWIHLQLSVVVFIAVLCLFYRMLRLHPTAANPAG